MHCTLWADPSGRSQAAGTETSLERSEGSDLERLAPMAAPRQFASETRERAVRIYHVYLADERCSKPAARKHVGSLLG